MALYRVTAKMFINNTLIDPDTMPAEKCVVEYDGIPGKTLQLITEDAAAEPVMSAKKPKAKAKTEAGPDAD